MAEQGLNARSMLTLLGRFRIVAAAAILVGAALGGGVAALRPPLYTSVSMVLLPSSTNVDGEPVVRDPLTEERVASSDLVLGPAGANVTPPLSADEMRERVEIEASTNDVITIEASAPTPQLAEALANAVSEAEIAYVAGAASALGVAEGQALADRRQTLAESLRAVVREISRTTELRGTAVPGSDDAKSASVALAQLTAQQSELLLQVDELNDRQEAGAGRPAATAVEIQGASPATRPRAVVHFTVHAAAGAALALLAVVVLVATLMRKNRRLRLRDEIADAIGSPVVASVRSHAARSVAGWAALMKGYEPSSVEAWALRLTLRQLFPQPGDGRGRTRGEDADTRAPSSMTLITLAGDHRALAIAPQLASYAATSGLRTRLVAAQRHESAASLWAACHRDPGQEEVRPGLLVETGTTGTADVDLTVAIVVIDPRKPELMTPLRTDVDLICLSPGHASADDLARVAVEVDDTGRRISGVVVADPDSSDPTSGRRLEADRVGQEALPTRLTGAPPTRLVAKGGR